MQFDPPRGILSMPVSADYKVKLHPLLDKIEAKFANLHKQNGSAFDIAEKRKQRKDVQAHRDGTGRSPVATTPSAGGGTGGGGMGGSGY